MGAGIQSGILWDGRWECWGQEHILYLSPLCGYDVFYGVFWVKPFDYFTVLSWDALGKVFLLLFFFFFQKQVENSSGEQENDGGMAALSYRATQGFNRVCVEAGLA